jgi:hypothetical protein
MQDEYTLKFFREHYIDHRNIPTEDQEKTREAFMAGAHTLMLMITNFLQQPDPHPEIRRITQELSEYMTIKAAEAQFETATVH